MYLNKCTKTELQFLGKVLSAKSSKSHVCIQSLQKVCYDRKAVVSAGNEANCATYGGD